MFTRTNLQSNVRVFITGHKGYIGSALFRMLNKIPSIDEVQGYDIVDGNDITNKDTLIDSMCKFQPTIVVHLAALSSVSACNENKHNAIIQNGVGTYNVLQAMKKSGCKHIIYASTSSVYGNASVPYEEEDSLLPCSSYGYTKLLGEHAIYNHYYNTNGSYLIYRMFNVVGNSGYKDIDNIANPGYDRLFAALKSGSVVVYGNDYRTLDGTCERDYVALQDVLTAYINGIFLIHSSNDKIREIINISTGRPWSVDSIVRLWNEICNITNINFKNIDKTYGKRREGDPPSVYGDNSKALKIINWKPLRKMESIICDLCTN